MKCLICKDKEADKTGSHIIPQFIIESMVNDGVKGRNKDQSFMIDSEGSDYNFGNEVLPEQIEDTLGRPASDEEIEKSRLFNHYTRDNVFCKDCEEELSVLESLYSRDVKPKIIGRQVVEEDDLLILRGLWDSVIYRCSAVEFAKFKMDVSREEELRQRVDYFLSKNEGELKSRLKTAIWDKTQFWCYPNPEDPSRNFVIRLFNEPDRWIFQVNEYTVFSNILQPDLTTLFSDGEFSEEDIVNEITYITPSQREALIKLSASIFAKEFLDNCVFRLIQAFKVNFGKSPSKELIGSFTNELLYAEDIEVTVRYEKERVNELINKYTTTRT